MSEAERENPVACEHFLQPDEPFFCEECYNRLNARIRALEAELHRYQIAAITEADKAAKAEARVRELTDATSRLICPSCEFDNFWPLIDAKLREARP